MGHSTVDHLNMTYEDITLKSDMGLTNDLILFDFAKAFDAVIHKLLLIKLRCLGIDGMLLQWIEMLLTQRSMCAKIADSFSRSAPVTSGVLQGVCFRTTTVLVDINHLVSFLNTFAYRIFADDIKLYLSYNSSDVQTRFSLQDDIDLLTNQ